MFIAKSSLLAAGAFLALAFASVPFESAEAQQFHRVGPGARVAPRVGAVRPAYRGGPAVRHRGGVGRGAGVAAGLLGAAIVGGALLHAGRPAPIEEDCRRIRERVWDDYQGRWVIVRRTVCD